MKKGVGHIWWVIIVAVLAVMVLLFSGGSLYGMGRKALDVTNKILGGAEKSAEELSNLGLSDLTEKDVKMLEEQDRVDVILANALREADEYYSNKDYEKALEFYKKFLELCERYERDCRPADKKHVDDRIKDVENKLREIELKRISEEANPGKKIEALSAFIGKVPDGKIKSQAEFLLEEEKKITEELESIDKEILNNYEEGRRLLASGLPRQAVEKFKESRFLAETGDSEGDLVNRYLFLSNVGLVRSYIIVEDCENGRAAAWELDSIYRAGKVIAFNDAKDLFLGGVYDVANCFYQRSGKRTEASKSRADYLATLDFVYSIDRYYTGLISRDKIPKLVEIYENVAYNLADPADCESRESIGDCHKESSTISIMTSEGLKEFNFAVTKEIVKKYPYLGCWWEFRTTNYCNYCDVSIAASKGYPAITSCYDYYHLFKGGANEIVCKTDPCGLGCRFVDNWGPNSCEKI